MAFFAQRCCAQATGCTIMGEGSVRGFVTDIPGEGLVKDMDQVPLVDMATILSNKDDINFVSKIHFKF